MYICIVDEWGGGVTGSHAGLNGIFRTSSR